MRIIPGARCQRGDHAVHLAVQKTVQYPHFPFRIVPGLVDHHVVSPLRSGFLDAVDRHGEKISADHRHHDPDRSGAAPLQVDGEYIGFVAHFFGRFPDPVAHFDADRGVILQRPRYRGSRNPQLPRDVVNRYFFRLHKRFLRFFRATDCKYNHSFLQIVSFPEFICATRFVVTMLSRYFPPERFAFPEKTLYICANGCIGGRTVVKPKI